MRKYQLPRGARPQHTAAAFSVVTMRSIVLNRTRIRGVQRLSKISLTGHAFEGTTRNHITGMSFTLELKKKGRSYVRDAAGRLDQTSGDGDT